MILEDLQSLPKTKPVIAEGCNLLPELVIDILETPTRAIWVIPSGNFQKQMYSQRGAWVQGVLAQCSDPEQAFRNWMDRDAQFALHVENEAGDYGLRVLMVDGQRSISENAKLVAQHFALTDKTP